jgi:hypothetical protein
MEKIHTMDSVTVITTALAAGAAAALQDGTKDTVLNAYHGLRDKVRELFAGNDTAKTLLDEHEKAPEEWQRPLAATLTQLGADRDPGLRSAAEALLALLDGAPSNDTKYNVSIRDSQIFSVGDHNHQVINVGDGAAG